MTATPPDNATHVGGTSLWLQEVNERVERSGIDTLGSTAQACWVWSAAMSAWASPAARWASPWPI